MTPQQPDPSPLPPTATEEETSLRDHATALARQDGRTEARAGDRAEAAREQTGPPPESSPETPAGAEALVTWDASPDQAGHRSNEAVPEDEADDDATLAEEGSGEAEEELRRAAIPADPSRHRETHE
jgi:hypothetical protein